MKKAFTLIEILISIIIFSIIIVFMYQAIAITQKSSSAYENLYNKQANLSNIKRIFYNDIFNQIDQANFSKISLDKNENSIFFLRSKNSLNGYFTPFIAYKVIDNNLYRFESNQFFKLPLPSKSNVKIDKILSGIEKFNIYQNKGKFLIYFVENNKQLLFEIAVPFSKKIVVVNS